MKFKHLQCVLVGSAVGLAIYGVLALLSFGVNRTTLVVLCGSCSVATFLGAKMESSETVVKAKVLNELRELRDYYLHSSDPKALENVATLSHLEQNILEGKQ